MAETPIHPDPRSYAQQFAKRTANAPARAREYPESDGKPMAETPIHMKAMNDAIMPLEEHYAERDDVYVGGNMMMYYVEDSPRKSVSADVFVAFGPSREPLRRVWKTWEEGKLADFVLEVTSKSTRRDDEERKRDIYRRLGVTEYWQFDPTGDYLEPVLKGRRLNATGAYRPIRVTTAPDGTLRGESKVLGLHLCLDGSRLRLFDSATSAFLLTNHDKYRIIKDQERALAERDRAIAQERRAREAAEAELERLKGRRTRH
ncbi:MAG: Uma2 family endonuclease [Gammaproteobacteria bacterium]|nr:Uma2 family endonuclease [Gammaproteobacteria bacterium]